MAGREDPGVEVVVLVDELLGEERVLTRLEVDVLETSFLIVVADPHLEPPETAERVERPRRGPRRADRADAVRARPEVREVVGKPRVEEGGLVVRLEGVLEPARQVGVLGVVDAVGTDRIGGERKPVVAEHVGERDRGASQEIEVAGEPGRDRGRAVEEQFLEASLLALVLADDLVIHRRDEVDDRPRGPDDGVCEDLLHRLVHAERVQPPVALVVAREEQCLLLRLGVPDDAGREVPAEDVGVLEDVAGLGVQRPDVEDPVVLIRGIDEVAAVGREDRGHVVDGPEGDLLRRL